MGRPRVAAGAAALVAALVPFLLVADGVQLLAHDWFVRFEYGAAGVPADRYGLSEAERTSLALTGLHSIQPQHREGIDLLRKARLPGGQPAFRERELRHMGDVRHAMWVVLIAQLLAIAGIAALAAAAAGVVRRGLRWGSLLTLALAALAGPLLVLGASSFLTGFHELLFSGNSWRFAERDTLRRLYPDRFWRDTALLLSGLAVVQALLLLAASRLLPRAAGERRAPANLQR
jgi:integral membrane protein (TIGR01906 family)